MNDTLSDLIPALVLSLPLIMVSIAGIILSRRRLVPAHPRAGRFATLGFLSLMGYAGVALAVRIYAASVAIQQVGPSTFARNLTLANLLGYALLLAAVVFILLATLADRRASGGARQVS